MKKPVKKKLVERSVLFARVDAKLKRKVVRLSKQAKLSTTQLVEKLITDAPKKWQA